MLYRLAKRVLFQMSPERAHRLILDNLDWATTFGLHRLVSRLPPDDAIMVMGLRFPNAVGLAAGFDKDGERVSAFGALGFGHIEVGTVTPLPQPGNPRPRCFRLPEIGGIINRMGFNNQGCDRVRKNLRSADAFRLRGGIVGINIGKNAVTPIAEAGRDYLTALRKMYDLADYLAINISSPNTKNLRALQDERPLCQLLESVAAERARIADERGRDYRPIAVKLAPDLSDDGLRRALDVIVSCGMDGVIATNTTVDHAPAQGHKNWQEPGGLSGAPLKERADHCLDVVCRHLAGRLPVIASGGVMSVADALTKIELGASLVQLYSGFIYRGPTLVADCAEAISARRQSA